MPLKKWCKNQLERRLLIQFYSGSSSEFDLNENINQRAPTPIDRIFKYQGNCKSKKTILSMGRFGLGGSGSKKNPSRGITIIKIGTTRRNIGQRIRLMN
jgi:hypothetical protein